MPTKRSYLFEILSLMTKIMWLKFRRPIIIYDKNCRSALGFRSVPGLTQYYDRWLFQYKLFKDDIRMACDALPEQRQFAIDGSTVSKETVERIVSAEWFRQRVFDMYLWHGGALRGDKC